MDSIRVPKVEHVGITKAGVTSTGTVHLTAHHIIFHYDDEKIDEIWVPYPLISLVYRLPQTLNGQSPLTIHTRTFESFTFSFPRDEDALDVFDSVKELTVTISVTQLYAFFYRPNPPFPSSDGWSLYSPREEFGRMGLGTRTKSWRFTDINKDYGFCPTYPTRLVVPTKISDTTLQYAAKYRSKARIPVLAYLHWANYGSITRCSQPMAGITQNRSVQDEKLIEAIYQTHISPETRTSSGPVYGATTTNLLVDARPLANAVAYTAKGAGSENMDNYKDAKKVYVGIDNIHVMRESLARVVEALREADAMIASINNDLSNQVTGISVMDRQALRRSGWLRHLQVLMEGTLLITRNIHVNSSHVLIHCSDGWDRTSQLSCLSQVCLDPFYRTFRGFAVMIEKDWLSFGHKFLDRCGHLSSEKFFISPTDNMGSGGGADAAQAFLASVQNRFAPQNHVKETSPVFHQFLECVRQMQRQFPQRFEFNERYLRQLYYHLYSCQFGTFLYNCEKDRRVGTGSGSPPVERTVSVWDFLLSPAEMEKNRNPDYDPSLDDPSNRSPGADMGVLFPNPKDIRFWHELYGRTDEEMNGRVIAARPVEVIGPIESAEDDPVRSLTGTPSNEPLPPSPSQPPVRVMASPSESLSSNKPPARISSPSGRRNLKESTVSLPEPSSANSLSPSSAQTSMVPDWFASSPNSPLRGQKKQPDYLAGAGTGVRSMWGKLSSNASAALSVVQDAYAGVAKDLGKSTSGGGETSAKVAELHDREMLTGVWGEESTTSAASSSRVTSSLASMSIGNNPWALGQSDISGSTSSWENPWTSTTTATQPTQSTHPPSTEMSSSSSLPPDPTIATPLRRTTAPLGTRAERTPQPTKDPPQNAGGTDPLGVGPL